MIRKIALAAAAGAVALGGLAVLGGGSASAATPTITTATSATISCTISSKAKLAPALKDNWVQSAHSGDPNPLVAAIPNTTFASGVSPAVTAKGKSIACTGTATDGTATATVTALKINLVPGNPGIDVPPLSTAPTGSCLGLLATSGVGDTAATYNATLSFKASGAKLAPTTINNLNIVAGAVPGGVGFGLSGGSVTGSLAGGTGKTIAFIDGDTLGAVAAAPPTSTNPAPSSNKCQPTLKIKAGNNPSASLKPPKGLKKITIGANILNPAEQSSICLRKGSACP